MSIKTTKKTTKEEDSILSLARERYRTAREADKAERNLAYDDICFAINDNGSQWDKSTRAIREGAQPPRPCLVMNKIPEKIDQVEGEFRQLKPSIKVKAVDSLADPKLADIIGGIIRHIEYNSTARAAYNMSHTSTLFCGRGAWRIGINDSIDDPFEQDIIIDRIPNVLSITFDPSAKKVDKSDGKYLFITEDVGEEEFKATYPDIDMSGWGDEDRYLGWRKDKTVLVAEYWWIEDQTKEAYKVRRNGVVLTVFKKEQGDEVLNQKMVKHPHVVWCKMVANKIIDGPYHDWPGKYIPIILQFGKETNVGGVMKTRGMVRFAKEPQRMYNYWTSSEAEQVALAPKAPYLVTPKMINSFQPMWDTMNTANYAYVLYNPDPEAPGASPQRQPPPMMSSATLTAKQGMEQDIMSAMNVYRASLGDTGQEVSGIAIQARVRQGSIGAYSYTDNFEYALVHSAKVLIDLIPHIYNSERIIRIRGENDAERVVPLNASPDSPIMQSQPFNEQDLVINPTTPYINDISIGKYDVVATIGPAYTTQREEALDKLIQIFETVPTLANVSIDLLVGLLDIPMSDELLERARKLVPPEFRRLEPGEEPPQEEPPDAATMIKMKEVEIKHREQLRKDFETQVNSILTLAKAESEESGRQMPEYLSQLEVLNQRFAQPQEGGM